MLTVRVSLGLLLLAALPAHAAELQPESSIRSVTVFPVGATIVRTADVALPVGPSTIIIDDLPAGIEPDSLKVEGAGSSNFAIASVETRYVSAGDAKNPEREALLREIREIEDRIAAVNDRIQALDGRRRFLERLIDVTPEGLGKGLAEGGSSIEQWAEAATAIGEGLAAVAEETRRAEIGRRIHEEALDVKRRALATLPAASDHFAVRVSVSADAAAGGTLMISYRTPYANWVPSYDAQLSIGEGGKDPSLAIVRRAEVSQATGENWEDVALTLSTARTLGGTAAPTLDTNIVTAWDAKAYAPPMPAAESTAVARPAPSPELADLIAGAPQQQAASHVEAAANFGDFRAEFIVPGAVSVATGEGARSMRIASTVVPARIEVKTIPMISDAAYLHAAFVPPEGAPFLPGKVALFRDGVFVGNGSVPLGRAGRELNLGFGMDDLVRVTRAALERTSGEQGILSKNRTESRSFRITVDNLHSFPVAITVLDRMPVAEDEKIQVSRISGATSPTAENVEDRRGVLAWNYTYEPGETREIIHGYQLSWPSDMQVFVDD